MKRVKIDPDVAGGKEMVWVAYQTKLTDCYKRVQAQTVILGVYREKDDAYAKLVYALKADAWENDVLGCEEKDEEENEKHNNYLQSILAKQGKHGKRNLRFLPNIIKSTKQSRSMLMPPVINLRSENVQLIKSVWIK